MSILCPEWVSDLSRQDVAGSKGIFDLHPASSRASLAFAGGDLKGVRAGDTLWLAGGGWVEVLVVTKSLIRTSGGRFHRETACRWQSHYGGHVVAFRTSTPEGQS